MTDTKSFGIVDIDIKATSDDASGSFEAILSAPTVDRDGEVIDGKAFEPLPERITIDVDHGMSVASTVGSGVPFYEGDILKVRGTFSSIPRAQEVRTLVNEGHVTKMSVAFMNARREIDPEDERPHIRQAELLNAAIVPIPSNRQADIYASKSGARNNGEDMSRLQQIHDLSVANGADCKHASHDDTKSTDTDPEAAAAPAAAPPAEATVDPKAVTAPVLARAAAVLAEASLLID